MQLIFRDQWKRRLDVIDHSILGGGKEIAASLFKPGDTLASKIAIEASGTISKLQTSSLLYCGVILLVIGLVANLSAQAITRRFEVHRAAAR